MGFAYHPRHPNAYPAESEPWRFVMGRVLSTILVIPCLLALACAPACSSDSGTTEPEGGGAEPAADSAGEDGTVAEPGDAPAGEPEDAAQPEPEPEVIPEPEPEGGPAYGLGMACEVAEDCDPTDANRWCFLGFCTTRCLSTAGTPIVGACSAGLSSESLYGTVPFGCPGDLVICLPGSGGQDAICSSGEDCEAAGLGLECAGILPFGGIAIDGVCLPEQERTPPGLPCSSDAQCTSLVCLGSGSCSAHCTKNAHCPAEHLCTGIGYIAETGDEEPSFFAGLCFPNGSPPEYCGNDGICEEGGFCGALVEPKSYAAQYWCVQGPAEGAALGEACDDENACLDSECITLPGAEAGVCSSTCPGGAENCDEGQSCAKVKLHANGTFDDPSDDKAFKACVDGSEGAACSAQFASWCEPGLLCEVPEAAAGEEPGLVGTCVLEVECAGAEDCDDGLDCTTDSCDGIACVHEIDAGSCMIDGICWTADEVPEDNACALCDPEAAQDAWTSAIDGLECGAATPCAAAATCQAGACTEGAATDCDDDDACTIDACDDEAGCTHEADTEACDDGDPCTDDLCDAEAEGGCTSTAKDCADGDACNQDSCESETGDCLHEPFDVEAACDDGDPCTLQACDAESGCSNPADPDFCDDGDPCTTDLCDAEAPEGCTTEPKDCGDDLECTSDTCDEETGDCVHGLAAGSCLIEELCVPEGQQSPGDACQTCQPATSQEVYSPATGGECEDGDPCTLAAQCDDGLCAATETDECGDDDACTTDSCVAGEGCANEAIPCADEDACTVDACDAETGCTNEPMDCSDGFACTDDSCDEGTCENTSSEADPCTSYATGAQPIYGGKCGGCHTTGSSGGHSIGADYEDAFLTADNSSCVGLNIGECTIVRIQSGQMPLGGGCGGVVADDAGNADSCITETEMALLEAWVEDGLQP